VKLGISLIIVFPLVMFWFFFAEIVMVTIMVAHDRWWALVPQMSYATSLILCGLVMIVGWVSGFLQGFIKEMAGK